MINLGALNKLEALDPRRWRTVFRKTRERLGVEIDGRSVRVVCIKRRGEGVLRLEAFDELDVDLRHASGLDRDRFRADVAQLGGGLTRVAVNLEHPTLRIRRMNFAKMPEQDLLEAIRWNFRDHVEVPIEKYAVGYTPVEEKVEENRMGIMAYGVAEEAIKEYTSLMESFGLKLISLEPTSTALLASFNANGVLDDGKYHACVAIGNEISNFIVMKGEAVLFCRPLAGVGEEPLVRLLVRNLSMKEGDAKHALAEWMEKGGAGGMSEVKVEEADESGLGGVEMTMKQFFSQMVIELQRSIDAFCIMYSVDRVDTIHVCGKGVFYPGLVSHLHKTLGVNTIVYNPFAKLLETGAHVEEISRRAPLFSVAVGLAIP